MSLTTEFTEAKAYILGFLASDGCVRVSGIEWQIQERDLQILEDIEVKLSELGFNPKFSSPRTINNKRYVRLRVHSRSLSRELEEFGITQRKSKTIRMPKIPSEFVFHFLRGLLDGDGSISIRRNDIEITFHSASKEFLEDISSLLNRIDPVFTIKKANEHARCFRITYYSIQARKLATLLYTKSTISLERKKLQAQFRPTKSDKFWNEQELNLLRKLYPSTNNADIANIIGTRNEKAIRLKAFRLGLRKT